MEPRIIKTEEQYRRYLDAVARLAANDPDADSNEGVRLELLAKLVEDYEKARFHFAQPDPLKRYSSEWNSRGCAKRTLRIYWGAKTEPPKFWRARGR